MREDYSEKLRHPKWQKLRLEVLERAGWKCQCCGDDNTTLEIHHLVYSNGEPWETPPKHLECLCSVCHQWRTEFNKFFGGRSLICTGLCRYFWCFYVDAFNGTIPIKASGNAWALFEEVNKWRLANIGGPTKTVVGEPMSVGDLARVIKAGQAGGMPAALKASHRDPVVENL